MAETSTSVLAGKRIVITRPAHLSAPIVGTLYSHGAEVVLLPVVQIEPPLDFCQFDDALRDLQHGKFDWIIFGSQNSVHAVLDRAAALEMNLRDVMSGLQVAAVGKVTASVARQAGFNVTQVGKGTGADLIASLAPEIHGKHVFLPRSDRAGAAHFAQLHQAGAHVREVVAYRTVPVKTVDQASAAATSDADAILFYSPSAVHAFVALVDAGVLPEIPETTGIGAIGPVTKENLLKEAKMRCDFEADEPTVEHVIAALTAFFEKERISSAGAPSR